MPLYLWHKLAELPAAWLGEMIDAPIDAGTPGDPGFWSGRLWWIGLCLLMVVPVLAIVAWIETQRRPSVPHSDSVPAILAGGLALFAGLGSALILGAVPGAVIGLLCVVLASQRLRRHAQASTNTKVPSRRPTSTAVVPAGTGPPRTARTPTLEPLPCHPMGQNYRIDT